MVCLYGADPLIEKTQGRFPTVTYRYVGEGISVDVCFLAHNPFAIAALDVYDSQLYPIYEP